MLSANCSLIFFTIGKNFKGLIGLANLTVEKLSFQPKFSKIFNVFSLQKVIRLGHVSINFFVKFFPIPFPLNSGLTEKSRNHDAKTFFH